MIKSFTDLGAYRDSQALYPKVTIAAKKFPVQEGYLSSQLCRAANSVHANIAEGFNRSEAEFKKYLTTALGSNNEVLSHLTDARNASYLSTADYEILSTGYTAVGKQIYRLREKWKKFSNF